VWVEQAIGPNTPPPPDFQPYFAFDGTRAVVCDMNGNGGHGSHGFNDIVFTDQQSASMMSCAGNSYVNTPAMDGLAASGMRFERAYCTNPVCVPSRFSLMTGRMPSAIGVRCNDHHPTLCDYACIAVPEELAGLSLRGLAEGRKPASWPDTLPVESEIGRMVVTERYKYVLYDESESREQLMDLWEDPGEMRNAAKDAEQAEVLRNLRRVFEDRFGQSI